MSKAVKIKIDKEFKKIIPPLTPDEYKQLETNLTEDGCRDPLVTWQGILLDGHNRLEICNRLGIEYQTVPKLSIKNRAEAKAWIINNQCGRRNLNSYQRTSLALQLEEILAPDAYRRMKAGKKLDPVQESAQGKTMEKIAKVAGVSRDTVQKVKYIEANDPTGENQEALRRGKRSIGYVWHEMKREEGREEKEEKEGEEFGRTMRKFFGEYMLDDYLEHLMEQLRKTKEQVSRVKGALENIESLDVKERFLREVADLSRVLSEITEEAGKQKRQYAVCQNQRQVKL